MKIIKVEGPNEFESNIWITLADDTVIKIEYPIGHSFDEKNGVKIAYGQSIGEFWDGFISYEKDHKDKVEKMNEQKGGEDDS